MLRLFLTPVVYIFSRGRGGGGVNSLWGRDFLGGAEIVSEG